MSRFSDEEIRGLEERKLIYAQRIQQNKDSLLRLLNSFAGSGSYSG